MSNHLERALSQVGIEYRPTEFPSTGLHCSLVLEPEQLRPLATALVRSGFFIETITAVDRPEDNLMDGVYLFNHYDEPLRFLARIPVSRPRPRLPSIGRILPGAVWHERETAEMFGIAFDDCPDTRNLLLPEDATFHPLRKDFTGTP